MDSPDEENHMKMSEGLAAERVAGKDQMVWTGTSLPVVLKPKAWKLGRVGESRGVETPTCWSMNLCPAGPLSWHLLIDTQKTDHPTVATG